MRMPSSRWSTSRRPLATLVAGLLTTTAIAGCGSSDGSSAEGSESSDTRTIAFSAYEKTLFYGAAIKGATEMAEEYGWELEEFNGRNTPDSQFAALENALASQPDALILGPIDAEAFLPVLSRFKEAGIPVVTVGDDVVDEELRATFAGADYEQLGEMIAQWLSDNVPDGQKVGAVFGIRGLDYTESKRRGAERVWSAEGTDVVMGAYTNDFTNGAFLEATENLLSSNDGIGALYSDTDEVAQGVIQAVKDAGIAMDDIKIAATGLARPDLLDLIEKGELDYSQSLCPASQGRSAVEVLHGLLEEDRTPEVNTYSEVVEVTSDNLAEVRESIEADCF